MDIDKLILTTKSFANGSSFGSLMDIDKLIPKKPLKLRWSSFGSLMDIDKLILAGGCYYLRTKFWFSDGY